MYLEVNLFFIGKGTISSKVFKLVTIEAPFMAECFLLRAVIFKSYC